MPATVISREDQNKNINWSLLWRLLEECEQPANMLTTQYRMHPEIRSWPSYRYYENRLLDAQNVKSYKGLGLPNISNIRLEPYVIINVDDQEKWINQSYRNEGEIEIIKGLINIINKKSSNHLPSIGIITFYSAQKIALKKYIGNNTKITGEKCPECDCEDLIRAEGCVKCPCGWTKCS